MSDSVKRWRETVELGILSVGRKWNKEHCQCDPSVGAAPCHYCAEHGAILAGKEMLEEINRLRAFAVACYQNERSPAWLHDAAAKVLDWPSLCHGEADEAGGGDGE